VTTTNRPNAPPAEQTTPGWRRFIEQYRAYMQIILVAAAVVSLAVKESSIHPTPGRSRP
jgi:P-type Ca2+ transporter type 2C